MYIDSHCHLIHKRLEALGGAAQVVRNAREAGIDGMLTVCCDIAHEFEQCLAVARESAGDVWCTIGTHPHGAAKAEEAAVTLDRLIELAQSDPRIVGIGESGLDYFYKHSPPEEQQESFRKHIRACAATGLPLVVHARDADGDIIRILREEGAGQGVRGVMHCFSSGRAMGEAALDLGFYISFSGIATFAKAEELRDFAKDVPADRILIETDAPFLAPEPHRGDINQPALMIHTGRRLAALRGVAEEAFAAQTSANFFALFDKARGTA